MLSEHCAPTELGSFLAVLAMNISLLGGAMEFAPVDVFSLGNPYEYSALL